MIKAQEPPDLQNLDLQSEDPILRMRAIGKQLWQSELGDQLVERLRAEPTAPPPQAPPSGNKPPLFDDIWERIRSCQGEQFHTARQLPFVYQVEGNGIWFFRDGKRIERKLTRKQFDTGVSRCPLQTTTEISDLIDYAYLFGLLTDDRIRGKDW